MIRTVTPDAYALPTQNVDERAATEPYLQPVFFGEPVRVPPHPADKPLPRVPLTLGEIAPTVTLLELEIEPCIPPISHVRTRSVV